jgi:hypothetical protein
MRKFGNSGRKRPTALQASAGGGVDGPDDFTCASCDEAAVAAAVAGAPANSGYIIGVPAGNCTWPNGIGWANKNIFLRGAGIGQTNITFGTSFNGMNVVMSADFAAWRIAGFTFQGNPGNRFFTINSAAYNGIPTGRWRIDHNRFNNPSAHVAGLKIDGANYGLIDHNQFDPWGTNGVAIFPSMYLDAEYPANPLMGNFAQSQAADFGTNKFLFVEDNTFVSNGTAMAVFDTSSGGARVVWRHNRIEGGFFYAHWPQSNDWTQLTAEIYRNTWVANADWGLGGSNYPMRLETMNGVAFENFASGFTGPHVWLDDRRSGGAGGSNGSTLFNCDGSRAWDGNYGDASAPGWPCLGQVGRAPGKSFATVSGGSKQDNFPFYMWSNGTVIGCLTGGTCTGAWVVNTADPAAYIKATAHSTAGSGNGEVDFSITASQPSGAGTHTLTYSPYQYPHPTTLEVWP